ncbi:MAG: hypothetical protein V7707_04645 [Motiliproteus sp.]
MSNSHRNEILQYWNVADSYDWSKLSSSSDLANLLLTPPDEDYIVTPLEEGRYQLSPHPASRTAWKVLDAENRMRYHEER